MIRKRAQFLIKRALLSTWDKTGLDRLANELVKWNIELISTSGTAHEIKKLGYKVISVSDYTMMPEILGGLFKTLHPKIHVGIIGDVNNFEHRHYMRKFGIKEIDLVVVNFYPFRKIVQNNKLDLIEATDYIDLGGVALVRTAAKASLLQGRVTVLTSPNQYNLFIEEIKKEEGNVSDEFKISMASQAFSLTSSYDKEIKDYFIDKARKFRI